MRVMKAQGGFTLIELVMVITILAIVSVSAGAALIDLGGAQSDGAARKLVSDIAYARRLAQNRSGIYGITFNAVAETYTIHLYDDVALTETAVTDPLTQAPMTVDFDDIPGLEGVDIQLPDFGGGATVRFMPRGTPMDADGTSLVGAGSVVLSRGGVSYTVSVQPNTGEVSYQ